MPKRLILGISGLLALATAMVFIPLLRTGNPHATSLIAADKHSQTPSAVLPPYLAAKQQYEDHWQRKLERALGFIPNIVVAVEVDPGAAASLKESVTPEQPDAKQSGMPRCVKVVVIAPRSYLAGRTRAKLRGRNEKPTRAEAVALETTLTAQLESITNTLIPAQPPGTDPFPRVYVAWVDDSP